jgi:hypothetical protein
VARLVGGRAEEELHLGCGHQLGGDQVLAELLDGAARQPAAAPGTIGAWLSPPKVMTGLGT